jgi:hypothetical protein
MRYLLVVVSMLLCPLAFAQDDLNLKVETRGDDESSYDEGEPSYNEDGSPGNYVGSPEGEGEPSEDAVESPEGNQESPGTDLDIGVSDYPEMVPVPNYPVYYAPEANLNYFFYDGLYWVYWEDNWYASSWYRGPWRMVTPFDVPLFVLRVPVRYYRQPPVYFHGWRADAPPRWGEHWGHSWEQHRHGWDRWDRHAAPHIAPLPTYQRLYSGDRYPRAMRERHSIRTEHYHYQPHEAVSQRHYIEPRTVGTPHPNAHLQTPAVHQRPQDYREHAGSSPQTQHLQPTPQAHPVHLSPQLQRPPSAPHDQDQHDNRQEHRRDHR